MNRLIIGTCCIPRIELYEINFPKIMDLILQINHIEIYWLINIDHPLWIKNITDATKADIINFIDNITNGAKINVVYFHEHKTIGFRDGIERIVKYIDANNLFTNETDYLYLEDDMSPSKNLNLKDILTLDPYKKIIYLGYSNSHLGWFGPHIYGKHIFKMVLEEYKNIQNYETQNAEYVFSNIILKRIINNNYKFISILLNDNQESKPLFRKLKRLNAFTIKKINKNIGDMPQIKSTLKYSHTQVYSTNSKHIFECDKFDDDSDYDLIYLRFMNDDNFTDLGRAWKHKHRKITGGTHARVWDSRLYK